MDSHKSRIAKPSRPTEQHSKVPTRSQAKKSIATPASGSSMSIAVSSLRNVQSKANDDLEKGARPVTAHSDPRPKTPVRRPSGLSQRSLSAPLVRTVSQQQPEHVPPVPSLRHGAGNVYKSENVVTNLHGPGSNSKPQRNVLRRKPSTINEYTRSIRGNFQRDQPMLSVAGTESGFIRQEQSVHTTDPTRPRAGTLLSPVSNMPSPEPQPSGYATGATSEPTGSLPTGPLIHDLRLPTPVYAAQSSSPSTRQSDSPSPWSRTSTPTSMSSYSPGITVPSKWAPRPRLTSPSQRRPPVTWRGATGTDEDVSGSVDPQGLPALRESLNSSSSGSTIKAGDWNDPREKEVERTKTQPLLPPPPSPPTRKSSTKAATGRAQVEPRTRPSAVVHNTRGQNVIALGSSEGAGLGSRRPSDASVTRDFPPPRPSREGAPDLNDDGGPLIPVIQSNLSGLRFPSHRRRMSNDTVASGTTRPSNTSTSSLNEPRQPRQVGTLVSNNLGSSSDSQLPRGGVGTLSGPSQAAGPEYHKGGQSPHTSPSKSASRFGFLTRRAKPGREEEVSVASVKSIKKGPVAGTGHEGYGRYSSRGRTGSMTSSGSRTRSASQSTTGSRGRSAPSRKGSVTSKAESELDDFLVERLEPVIITGGNRIVRPSAPNAELARTERYQSSFDRRPSIDSQASSSTEFSAFSGQSSDYSSPNVDVNADLALGSAKSSLSYLPGGSGRGQWKLHGSDQVIDKSALRILPPIDTDPAVLSHSRIQHATGLNKAMELTSYAGLRPGDVSEGREGYWLRPKDQDQPVTPPEQRNISHRLGAPFESPGIAEVQVKVERRNPLRSLPHYALLDPGEDQSPADLEDIMHEVERFQNSDNESEADKLAYDDEPAPKPKEHVPSVLLPDPPALPPGFQNPRPVSPKVILRPTEPSSIKVELQSASQSLPSRPSRLQQVGRIPRVVSTRVRKPPPESFSRPFSSVRPDMALASSKPNQMSRDGIATTGGPQQRQSGAPMPAFTGAIADSEAVADDQFLVFPPRKGSQLSSSSGSDPARHSATTAIIPSPGTAPGADEVWREYDDLLDDVFSPGSGYDLRSSYGFPSQYENPNTDTVEASSSNRPPHKNLLPTTALASQDNKTSVAGGSTAAPVLSHRQCLLDTTATPDTPVSFSDLFAGYEARNLSHVTLASPNADTPMSPTAPSNSTLAVEAQSGNPGRLPSESSQHTGHTETQQNGLDSEMNLRFGALMTSRWLSFGRVLFSPAHDEIKQASGTSRQDRILILDGLGNDDWSFYCALTYPDATIYNLSPSQASSSVSNRRRESGAFQSPPNHRQIHHLSFANPFPFPKGFFAAVVLRFPVASSEMTYRNAISECKRVLRPGGYLEISVLDLDLMHMGTRTKRAVRSLKERMQAVDNSLSLKPLSDTIQRLLGRRGFEMVNRCMLGVPVAGNVADSREASVDGAGQSLSDLLRDHSQEGDKGITKMVARVGRWWYTRCYEIGVLPNGDLSASIWNDRAVLRECEKSKTSFKLLICYAQKPLTPRRRTVSV